MTEEAEECSASSLAELLREKEYPDSSESADDCAGSFLPAWTYQESADDCAGSFLPAWTYQEDASAAQCGARLSEPTARRVSLSRQQSAESTDESAAAGSMQSAQRDASAAQAGVLIMLALPSLVSRGFGSLPSTAPPPNTPQTPQETVQSAESADATASGSSQSAHDSSHADEDSSESVVGSTGEEAAGEEAAGADDSSGEGQRQSRRPFTNITNRKRPRE